jgi:hypothetical protein
LVKVKTRTPVEDGYYSSKGINRVISDVIESIPSTSHGRGQVLSDDMDLALSFNGVILDGDAELPVLEGDDVGIEFVPPAAGTFVNVLNDMPCLRFLSVSMVRHTLDVRYT